jgi:multimeric flavodoxin WrbA
VEIDVRKGMPSTKLPRNEFEKRMRARLADPAFAGLEPQIVALIDAAWDGYAHSRKSPRAKKAGSGYADPDYDLAIDWIHASQAIKDAQQRHDDPRQPTRILHIKGSSRSDQTGPGEMSKSYRLCMIAEPILTEHGHAVDFLDLSRLTSEMGRQIHPCKSCVSTSMPLCHWPCSCCSNYSLQQTDDWMNEIYPLWVEAHGIMIITPVNWYHAPTGLKAMIDRLVCADGGNPDQHPRTARNPRKPRPSSSKAGITRSIWPDVYSRLWCMVTAWAPRRCAAVWSTG